MLQLYIGDKNYSSWSMRPWLVLRGFDIDFDEVLIRLADDDTHARIGEVSPSGRVPVLRDQSLTVWDSLAIIEYLAERFPQLSIWPSDTALRAQARSIAAEMHSGFTALRQDMPMNIRNRYPGHGHSDAALADCAHIDALWQRCLAASGGPFLFGAFSAADAFYAPVVTRLRTYEVPTSKAADAYRQAIEMHPAVAAWVADAWADLRGIDRYDLHYA